MRKVLYTLLTAILLLCLTLPVSNVMAVEPTHYYIAAHAVVTNGCQTETAWADCNDSIPFNQDGRYDPQSRRGSWGYYIDFQYPNPNYWWYGLYAGQNNLIGWVKFSIVDDTIKIKYEITDLEWYIIETHVAVVTNPEDIPRTKKGNPKVGQFVGLDGEKSGIVHDPPVQVFTYTYDL